MKSTKYFINKLFITCACICLSVVFLPLSSTDMGIVKADKPCIIVIDPGHGGENLGADYNGYIEKDINMVVATAMYEELLKYDNVEVYLTHTEDVDMSLKERAEFAAEKNADFLFCLHFNMSVNHNLFGTEVWISAFDKYYSEGLSFGKIQIEAMEELGLYSRGVKTKLMENEKEDYYGIIRESRKLGVTCALIEHCHLDNFNDDGYYETDDKLKELGRIDATSAAKYLGLSSELLDVDYSDYPREEVPIPDYTMKPDGTDPDVCYIEEVSCDTSNGNITFELTAQDYDSHMLYYSYSINDGATWSELFAWEEGKDTLEITIKVPAEFSMPHIKFRAHNLFDRYTESNMIVYPTFHYSDAPVVEETSEDVSISDETVAANSDNVEITFRKDKVKLFKNEDVPFIVFLEICLIIAAVVFFAALIARITKGIKRSKSRKHPRNRDR